jgi:hypothetical protein
MAITVVSADRKAIKSARVGDNNRVNLSRVGYVPGQLDEDTPSSDSYQDELIDSNPTAYNNVDLDA